MKTNIAISNIKITLIMLSGLFMLVACEDLSPETPNACLQMEILVEGTDEYSISTTASVGESVFFSSCGSADKYALFTGDSGHDYDNPDDVGAYFSDAEGTRYQYSYEAAGTYTVVLVATNMSIGSTDVETASDITSLEINITE